MKIRKHTDGYRRIHKDMQTYTEGYIRLQKDTEEYRGIQ